jgi:hypothetical protein
MLLAMVQRLIARSGGCRGRTYPVDLLAGTGMLVGSPVCCVSNVERKFTGGPLV